jgi:RNA-binding protein NOB1
VTKEMERVFCPRCGNLTLERVEVSVGADGAEFYGVKKRHVLRGTKYSLPKPRGGRRGNPILSEDMMRRQRPRKVKKAADAAEAADPFAPGYGATAAWTPGGGAGPGGGNVGDKGLAMMLSSWKNNPNEVQGRRNNRRR